MRGSRRSAGDAARRALRRIDKNGAMERASAVSAWRDAAGPEVSGHARGFAMRERELVVFVDSPVWASELAALSEHYRTAVNGRLGKESVSSVRFTVSRVVEEERRFEDNEEANRESYSTDKVQPEPASEIERLQIERMATSIKNEAVREAVVKAAIADLEWKKGLKARNESQAARERARGPKSGL